LEQYRLFCQLIAFNFGITEWTTIFWLEKIA
jgi:hypothetical protein